MPEHFKEPVNCMITDGPFLWIGNNNGLHRINRTNGSRVKLTRENGLPLNIINTIASDSYGYLWIGTRKGLSRLDTSNFSIVSYNLTGLTADNNVNSLKYNTLLGCVEVVTDFSMLSFYLPKEQEFTLQRAPSIVSCSLDGALMDIRNSKLDLSESDRMLMLEVSCPSNPALSGVKYAYMLKGLDTDWIALDDRQQIIFSVLPSGDFTLLVKASLDGVHWIESAVPLKIQVQPLFYKRLSFILSTVVFIALLVMVALQRKKRIELKNMLAIQNVRNRIAADLHDDVASSLSGISILSEVALQKIKQDPERAKTILQRIGESSRSIISDMSDMVWSVNPENDTLESIGMRMQDFAASMLGERNIAFQLVIPPADRWPKMTMQSK
jgi:signal transduction histidine kinase